MITSVANQEPLSAVVQPYVKPFTRSRENRRPDRVLIAEHRDEVFARLAADLRELGYTVFRAGCAEDVCGVYSYGQIELVLYNFSLPCEDIWLSTRRLKSFDAYARIWLYVPSRATFGENGVDLSRIERVICYRGDLFHLGEQIHKHLLTLTSPGSLRGLNRVATSLRGRAS